MCHRRPDDIYSKEQGGLCFQERVKIERNAGGKVLKLKFNYNFQPECCEMREK
jgi:hypothetical protein